METSTPQRILSSAIEAFAQQGFLGASVDGVAVAAGVTSSAIRYHFPGKELLYVAAVRQACSNIDSYLLPRIGRMDPGTLARVPLALLESLAEACTVCPHELRLLTTSWIHPVCGAEVRATIADLRLERVIQACCQGAGGHARWLFVRAVLIGWVLANLEGRVRSGDAEQMVQMLNEGLSAHA